VAANKPIWLLLMTGHAAHYSGLACSVMNSYGKSCSLSMDTYSKDWSCLFYSTEQKREASWLLAQAHMWSDSDSDRCSIFAGGIAFLTQMSSHSPTIGDIQGQLGRSLFGHVTHQGPGMPTYDALPHDGRGPTGSCRRRPVTSFRHSSCDILIGSASAWAWME